DTSLAEKELGWKAEKGLSVSVLSISLKMSDSSLGHDYPR
uniref:UDP-glucose 4-epimerase n=1 Tax=Mesocestoides corti TaxID=53468 RepID=A0A5K3G2H8_MESCO